MQYTGVLDCNNFFVSCERLFRPDLKHRPVVVLSSNDGCIVARSQEIKDKGIPMGVPYFQVKDILKDIGAVCFSSHFALYRDISSRVFTTMREHMPTMEIYSIDEAFFCFEADGDQAATAVAKRLKEAVEQAVGIPVSVGVSDTKTRAKLVNDTAKKSGGIAVAAGEGFVTQYRSRPLRDIWGVGRQLQIRYERGRIFTVGDLLSAPVASIQSLTQIVGRRLQAELGGQVIYPVTTGTSALPQSCMSTRSFRNKTNDWHVIADACAYHVRQVMADLREQDLCASTLSVLLYTSRHGDYSFRGGSVACPLTLPTDSTIEAIKIALEQLATLYEPGVPYTKTGVVAGGLMPKSMVPGTLFASQSTPMLDELMDSINNRFGRETVMVGHYEKTPTWTARRDLVSPAYTTQWAAVPHVRAA